MSDRISVLIVDDDETDRYIARRRLGKDQRIGEIHEASSGTKALEMLEKERFSERFGPHPPRSLVLLDINMPVMSGFDVLDQLHADDSDLPHRAAIFVMLTSSSYFGDHERAAGYDSVDGYIEKPLTAEKLDELIEQFWSVGD